MLTQTRLNEIDVEIHRRVGEIMPDKDSFILKTVNGSQLCFEMELDTLNWLSEEEFYSDSVNALITSAFRTYYDMFCNCA